MDQAQSEELTRKTIETLIARTSAAEERVRDAAQAGRPLPASIKDLLKIALDLIDECQHVPDANGQGETFEQDTMTAVGRGLLNAADLLRAIVVHENRIGRQRHPSI